MSTLEPNFDQFSAIHHRRPGLPNLKPKDRVLRRKIALTVNYTANRIPRSFGPQRRQEYLIQAMINCIRNEEREQENTTSDT